MSYDLGAIVSLSATIKDSSGALSSAGSVTVTITAPDGTATTSAVLAPTGTGLYDYDYVTTQAGRHVVRWVSTGAVQAAYTDTFDAVPADPGLIVSLADMKKQLNMTGTADDAELIEFGQAATAVVEQYVGAVARRVVAETVNGGRSSVLLTTTPVIGVTSVTESGTVLDASGYYLIPGSGVLQRVAGLTSISFLSGTGNVTVVYTAGKTIVPANERLAAKMIIQHMWETQRPAGGGPFTQGGDDYDPRYSYSVPRRALELLGEPIGGIA